MNDPDLDAAAEQMLQNMENLADEIAAAELRERCELVAAIAERNQRCLEAWRMKRGMRRTYPDSCAPEWRLLLNRWFAERRELANRWLFKRRVEKRNALRNNDWSKNARKPYV